ncbi:DUF11 domain-containing protein, partial [Methanobrevibacter curvatus]|uniref:DUF11 domain-containing protein n=1 Tax=Methanobrevibacter curvatus TaxID=49547 RepID=UPI000A579DB0
LGINWTTALKSIAGALGIADSQGWNNFTVHIAPGLYAGSLNVNQNVNDNATFLGYTSLGGAVVFDGSNGVRSGFLVGGNSNVTSRNITYVNGSEINGGAVYVSAGSTFNALNNTFANNNAKSEGGAIYTEDNSYLYVNTSGFDNNNAITRGGAISAHGYANINSSTFTRNSGYAIYLGKSGSQVTSSNILNNTGGIYIGTTATSGVNINYNRIVGNNNSGSYSLYYTGQNADVKYNWWGNNNITSLIYNNGVNLNNSLYYVLELFYVFNNRYVVYTNTSRSLLPGTVTIGHRFVLNDGSLPANTQLLPNFDISVQLRNSTNLLYSNVTNYDGSDYNRSGYVNGSSFFNNLTVSADGYTVELDLRGDPVINLTVSKTANVTATSYLGYITFTLNVTNYGPDVATNLIMLDVLSAGSLVFINASSASYNNVSGLWTISSLNVGESVVLVIVAQANTTGGLVNEVNVSSVDQINIGENESFVFVGSSNQANVSVSSKIANVSGTVLNGGLVTYVVTVNNSGPNNATGVRVSDLLDSRLIYINSTRSAAGDYNPVSGLWVIDDLYIGVPVTLTIVARINGVGLINNTANVTAINEVNLADPDDTYKSASFTAVSTVNLSITKKSNVSGNVLNGAFISYVVNVTNFGPNTATGLELSDVLDNRLIYVNSTLTNSVSYDNGTGKWIIGSLANGSSAVLTIVVRLNGIGNITNTVSVTGLVENNTGDTSANTSDSGNITVVPTVNLSITKKSNVTGSTIL